MIRNQCRYCANLVVGDFCYCGVLRMIKSEDSCKRSIGCLHFDFCQIDAFGVTNYDKRKWNHKQRYEQMHLDLGDEYE